jgi:glycosyltransferase involved in cell wall biosynthesis
MKLSNSTPQVSVIIPAYNTAQYICQTLESVFSQDHPSVEVIVIDDGSTDNTSQVLEPYLKRIHYVRQPNAGPSAARNHGLSLASGKYIAFLDSDDLLLPGKLTQQATMLSEQPHLGYIHSGWHLIDTDGKMLGTVDPWRQAPQLDLKTWLISAPTYMGAMLFKREWIERAGGFDPSLYQAEDVKLMLTLTRLGCVGAWQYQPSVCYRRHRSNITQNGPQQATCITRVLTDFFAQPNLPVHIRDLENEVQYNVCLWCVWQLYVTGYVSQITPYLRRSLNYTDTPAARTVQRWLGQLVLYCRTSKHSQIEELQAMFPYFKAAIQVNESQWVQMERVMNLVMLAESRLKERETSRAA